MTFVQPAHASTQSIVIDRIVEVEQVVDSRQGTSYIVQKGDSLWKIAERQLQDGNPSVRDIDVAWRELWEHNRDIIGDNPSLIYVGQKLSLP
jgi:nucleoid-associated protein YgaU